MQHKYYNLFQFLGGYFYQGFGNEYADPEIAVEDYIKGSSPVKRETTVKELREIISETPELELGAVIFAFGCYYKPQKHRGITMKTWLEQVIAQVEQSLDEVPKNKPNNL